MFRTALAAWIALTSIAAAADPLYVATLHILTTKGTYETSVIETTAGGVGFVECDLRKDAWWAEHGPMFEELVADLKTDGQQAGVEVTCERLD